jgi:hypothetical protein
VPEKVRVEEAAQTLGRQRELMGGF